MGNIIQLNHNGNKAWISLDDVKNLERFYKDRERRLRYLIFDLEAREKNFNRSLNKDHRVYALIMVGHTIKMCFYDKATDKAYKLDGYAPTWMEWKYFGFIRFATSMDL